MSTCTVTFKFYLLWLICQAFAILNSINGAKSVLTYNNRSLNLLNVPSLTRTLSLLMKIKMIFQIYYFCRPLDKSTAQQDYYNVLEDGTCISLACGELMWDLFDLCWLFSWKDLEIFLALAETALWWLFIVGQFLAMDKKVFVEVSLLIHNGQHVALKANTYFSHIKPRPQFLPASRDI